MVRRNDANRRRVSAAMSARERVIRLIRTMTSTPARRLVTAGAALGIAGAVAAYAVLILSSFDLFQVAHPAWRPG